MRIMGKIRYVETGMKHKSLDYFITFYKFSVTVKIMSRKRIRNIYLHLTKSCNLRCTYCYLDAGEPLSRELSAEELHWLFKDIAVLLPEKVVFTGGEPFMRKDIFAIAADFRSTAGIKGIKVCLMTNGALINNLNANLIAENFDEVRISLDGTEEINDRLRGEGTFRAVEKAVRLLRLSGVLPSISITVTSQNIKMLEEVFIYIMDKLFISNIHLSSFKPVGRGSLKPQLNCSLSEINSIVSGFWMKRFGGLKKEKEHENCTLIERGSCGVGCHINILPDGSVYPCHVLSMSEFLLGNIKNSCLSDILEKSEKLKKLEALNFREEKLDSKLKKLAGSTACLGELYYNAPEEMRKLLL